MIIEIGGKRTDTDTWWMEDITCRETVPFFRYNPENKDDWRMVFIPTSRHATFANTTHGGILMTFADNVMANYIAHTFNTTLVTKEMKYKFLAPVPLNKMLIGSPEAKLSPTGAGPGTGREYIISCTLSCEGKKVGIAEGIYIRFAPSKL